MGEVTEQYLGVEKIKNRRVFHLRSLLNLYSCKRSGQFLCKLMMKKNLNSYLYQFDSFHRTRLPSKMSPYPQHVTIPSSLNLSILGSEADRDVPVITLILNVTSTDEGSMLSTSVPTGRTSVLQTFWRICSSIIIILTRLEGPFAVCRVCFNFQLTLDNIHTRNS